MSFGPPALKGPLTRYRILSPTASVRVSPLCLGTMNFGSRWRDMMGACDQKTTEEILDFFYSQGGNFLDTSNNYQDEEAETWVGEWMRKRGVRDQMVVATKYTTVFRGAHRDDEIVANFTGNGAKSLHTSVNASLRKLQTDYIDLVCVFPCLLVPFPPAFSTPCPCPLPYMCLVPPHSHPLSFHHPPFLLCARALAYKFHRYL